MFICVSVAEGCDMVSTLAQSSFFGLQADFFVDPLLQSVKTLPLKFRLRCLRSGLHPVMAKSPLTIPKVMEYLEKTWSTSSSPQWQFCLGEQKKYILDNNIKLSHSIILILQLKVSV